MEGDADLKAIKGVEQALAPEDNVFTLSTGVVLRGKQVPPLLLVKVMSAYPRPKVPVFQSPTMGREMENPDDPDYQERIRAWKMDSSNILLNTLILLGTELVSLPKKMPGPESNGWLEEYRVLGLETFPENKSWRYLTWLTFKAAPDVNDLNVVKEVVGRLSGVPESKVEAAEQFPGNK